MHQTDRNYLAEIEGLGPRMPVVFGCLTAVGLSLTGIPPFAGFVSKWNIATAALVTESPLGIAAAGVLICSAFLTAVYMGQMIVKAWFPGKESRIAFRAEDKDPGWKMILPLVVFACVILFLGLGAKPLMELIEAVAYGTL